MAIAEKNILRDSKIIFPSNVSKIFLRPDGFQIIFMWDKKSQNLSDTFEEQSSSQKRSKGGRRASEWFINFVNFSFQSA